jgi:transcriptional regulator with GAF, ATPase, and Fis domain
MVAVPHSLLPADEAERLQSLQYYDVLQSLQEEFFDELTALLGALFQLPIAYIGLVGAELVQYQARYGLPPLPPQPRAEVLCAQVVKHGQVVVYRDLAATPPTPTNARAIQNSLAHQVRFYAGAPLRMRSQHVIGTLCLAGQHPREFSEAEQNLLEVIADLVSQAIVVRHECRSGARTGNVRWQAMQLHARDEVYALGALVRYLVARYNDSTPVPEEILRPVRRRVSDLQAILHGQP